MRVVVSDEYSAAVQRQIEAAHDLVAQNVKWRKSCLGMSLWELSAAFGGMDAAALSRYVNGKKRYSLEVLVKFSSALGVELADWHLPHSEFKEKYEGEVDAPFLVRIETTTARSRSSSRSKAVKTSDVTKDSPFCQPTRAA